MKRQTKLESTEQQQQSRQIGTEQQAQQPAPLEFASPEELLRYDAGRTEVPGGIAQRLQKSIETEPPPASAWWKRLFRRRG